MSQLLSQQTTMIGSMPHKTAQEAMDILQRYPLSIPVWPQLPKRSFREGMMPQYSEGFPGIKIDMDNKRIWLEQNDEFLNGMAAFYEDILSENIERCAISMEHAEGFHAFLEYMEKQEAKPAIIKGQVTGPFTYGLSINIPDSKAIWFDEQYRDVIVKGLAAKALWQAERLKKLAESVIIFFDEPIFSALGTPAYMGIDDETVVSVLNELSESLHKENIKVGVHCCGNMDWPLLAQSNIDIINFDAYGYGDKIALYPDAIQSFLGRGGTLAWGIVPTGNPEDIRRETSESLKNRVEELLEQYVKKGISEERLINQRIFTPSCGMGTLTEQEAGKVLELLHGMREDNG